VGKYFEKHVETECVGVPYGGTLFGFIIGILLIFVGVISLIGIDFHFWSLTIIFFGLLVFGGAIYTITNNR